LLIFQRGANGAILLGNAERKAKAADFHEANCAYFAGGNVEHDFFPCLEWISDKGKWRLMRFTEMSGASSQTNGLFDGHYKCLIFNDKSLMSEMSCGFEDTLY